MDNPKWITPERQARLVELFNQSQGFCVYGHSPCKGEWVTSQRLACYWGNGCKCPTNPDNLTSNPPILCNRKLDIKLVTGLEYLPCQVLHVNKRLWRCSYSNHACYKAIPRMGVIGTTLLEGECHYNQIEARLIKEWVNDDRLDRLGLKRVEDIEAHRTNDRTYPLHGRFSGISQDVYYNNQPEYFIENYGVSGLNFKPFAKLRLASSPIRLYVNLADMLKPLSKNARHKATRYKRIPITLQARIDYACLMAVKDFKR